MRGAAARRRGGAAVLTEAQFTSVVVKLAKTLGWRVFHVPDSRWVTEKGFPDLAMIHEGQGRAVFVELKTEVGRLRPEQKVWLAVLDAAGIETAVWRPADLARSIPEYLKGPHLDR